MFPNPKIRCILDPSRRVKSYNETVGDISWHTLTEISETSVRQVLGCKGLQGYVFPERRKKDAVRIYEWVSGIPSILLRTFHNLTTEYRRM